MGKYGPDIGPNVGNATRMPTANGSHNFQRSYYRTQGASGTDTRVHYEDLYFNNPGGGEVIRARAIANGLLSAGTGTINAAHFTGRVAAAKTVAGALNAIRATLEVAGSTPTPGGTLSALQLDTNAVTGTVFGANDAFARVTNSGAGKLTKLFSFEAVGAHDATTAVCMESAAYAASDLVRAVKCVAGGEVFYLVGTTTAPKA
jgi:hypothetical protein